MDFIKETQLGYFTKNKYELQERKGGGNNDFKKN